MQTQIIEETSAKSAVKEGIIMRCQARNDIVSDETPRKNSRERQMTVRISLDFRAILATASALTIALAGCVPRQEAAPQEECFDANVNLVDLGDQQFTMASPGTDVIDQIMEDYLAGNNASPGCAVGVVVGNEVRYLQGYGEADRALGTPYTHSTMQGVGSVSKTITALAIMQLVEAGEISLDDQVNQYLPYPHFNLLGVTIRDLLGHEGGLPTFPDWESDFDTEQEFLVLYPAYDHPGINPRFVQQGYNESAVNPPPAGSGLYSNTGYSLLGAVIDSVTNEPGFTGRQGYEAFTWWNVALKSGVVTGPTMTSMCLDTYWREDDILNLATGYQSDGVTVFPNSVNPDGGPGGWRGPPGGWAMTIGDLSRLMIGINTNQFVTPELKGEMLDAEIEPPSGDHTYGLGVWQIENLGRPTFMHGGNIDGFTARYTAWPEEGLGVALMCNREQAGQFRQITNDIASLYINASSAPPPSPNAQEDDSARRLIEVVLSQADDVGRRDDDLTTTPEGEAIIRAMEAGDLGTAMAISQSWLADNPLGEFEPSPLSGGLDEQP